MLDVKLLKYTFTKTSPIFAGFTFLGISYGIYMHSLGFNPIYAILMSALIFAGSMEFIAAQLLLTTFDPINVFFLTLMLNARHIFYGIALLNSYRKTGIFKYYLIFGLCDETFVINKSTELPKEIDKTKFFYV